MWPTTTARYTWLESTKKLWPTTTPLWPTTTPEHDTPMAADHHTSPLHMVGIYDGTTAVIAKPRHHENERTRNLCARADHIDAQQDSYNNTRRRTQQIVHRMLEQPIDHRPLLLQCWASCAVVVIVPRLCCCIFSRRIYVYTPPLPNNGNVEPAIAIIANCGLTPKFKHVFHFAVRRIISTIEP